MVESGVLNKSSREETEIALPSGETADSGNGLATTDHHEEAAAGQSDGAGQDWPVVDWLPIVLTVALPIPTFRVRDLLALDVGTVIATEWPNGDDLPLSAGIVQLAWVDMETVEQSMAVRLTRLL